MNGNGIEDSPAFDFQKTELRVEPHASDEETQKFCVACLLVERVRNAIGHTSHPDYRRLALCADCIELYDRGRIE